MTALDVRCPECHAPKGERCQRVGGRPGSRPHLHLRRRQYAGRLRQPTPMLDPTWTPAKGYAHALALLKLIERPDRVE